MADKKTAVCTKMYILANGEESRSAHVDAVGLEFRFANGETEVIAKGDNPEAIEAQLAWFGRSEKYGNFYAGAKGDASRAHEMFMTGKEVLAGGEWSERGGGEGPRPSMVIEAVVAALEEAGETVDTDRRAKIEGMVRDKDGRKAALANPAINAHYESAKADRAKVKAKAAKDAAKGAETDLSAF